MKRRCIECICLLVSLTSLAQDPHFSQYYASPSTVNPALTGFFKGNFRVSGIYRQQWAQYGDPFATGTVAFESKTGKSRMEEGYSTFAWGGMMMYDKTPGGVIKTQNFQGLLAYHQILDKDGYHRLGIGFMAGLSQKKLDLSHVTWGSQFSSYGFNTSLPSNEPLVNSSVSNMDLQAGLAYTFSDDTRTFYFGTSMYHLASPQNYFYDKNTVQQNIPKRFNINTGGSITTDYLYFAASALYMKQGNTNYTLAGASIGMPFGNNGVLYTGAWYRFGEAIIPVINLQFNNTNIGLSYDIFLNGKTYVKPRSIELSLSWRSIFEEPSKTSCYSF